MVRKGYGPSRSKGGKKSSPKGKPLSKTSIHTVRSVLEGYISRYPELQYQVKIREALRIWPSITDDYTNRHTDAVMIKDRTMYVNADSSALATELTLREEELLDRLNRELGIPLLRHIHFKSGHVSRKEESHEDSAGLHGFGEVSGEREEAPPGKESSRLTARTLKRIDSMVSVIDEEELRSALKRFLRVIAQRGGDKRDT
jgi:hypothetical protein